MTLDGKKLQVGVMMVATHGQAPLGAVRAGTNRRKLKVTPRVMVNPKARKEPWEKDEADAKDRIRVTSTLLQKENRILRPFQLREQVRPNL